MPSQALRPVLSVELLLKMWFCGSYFVDSSFSWALQPWCTFEGHGYPCVPGGWCPLEGAASGMGLLLPGYRKGN